MSSGPQILFPMAVTAGALLEYNSPKDKVTHEVAVKALLDHGILSFGPGDKVSLHLAISALVGRPNRAWSVAIEALGLDKRVDDSALSTPVQTFITEDVNRSGSGETVKLAIAEESVVTSTPPKWRDPSKTEIVSLIDVNDAGTLKAAQALESFVPGSSREDVGNSVLKPLALRSTEISVFDPHLFDDVLGTSRGSKPRDHIQWLVNVISEMAPSAATLRLIGDFPSQKPNAPFLDKETVSDKIQKAISGHLKARIDPMTIEVTLFQGTSREVKASNRYVLFDCGFSFQISHDVLRLGAQKIPGPDAFTVRRLDKAQSDRARMIVEGYRRYQENALMQFDILVPLSRSATSTI